MKILITGCSSGLGFGLASHYLNQGHQVFGISRKPNDELSKHSSFRFLSVDISNLELLRKEISKLLESEESLDLVVLNAGVINGIKDLKDTSIDEIKHVMDVNVWANKVLIDALFSLVGTIHQVVAISSGAALRGTRGWNAYSLSKATLNMLIDLYSNEYEDCHFCAMAPGLVETGMQDYLNNLPQEYEYKFPMVSKLKDARGTDRMPKPLEAARIVSESIGRAKEYPSGSYLDVRKM